MPRKRKFAHRPALCGGPQAVSPSSGQGQPKIGVDEFMSIAERFGFSASARAKMRKLLQRENLANGPHLGSYFSGLRHTKLEAFEAKARRIFGSKYAIGVNSGTGALHAALVAAGVGPGAEVIVPAIGFIATASAVVMAKGIPVFCDVDESLGMDPAKIEPLITRRTVALVPTHIMGSVCDMGAIMRIARRRRLMVIEDAAQSCGGRFKGRYAGSIGHMGIFSISAYKIVGGGEGGLILTDDERLCDRAHCLVDSGALWRPDRFAPPRYDGELFCGSNYRMSELEAAVDVVQLARMQPLVNRFRGVHRRIRRALKTYREITPQKLNDPKGEIGYRIRFFPQSVELGAKILEALNARGLLAWTRGNTANPNWHIYNHMYPVTLKRGPTADNCPFECPIYLQRGGKVQYARGDCPVADDLFARMISLNLDPWLSARDCADVAAAINAVLSAHCTEDPGARPWE